MNVKPKSTESSSQKRISRGRSKGGIRKSSKPYRFHYTRLSGENALALTPKKIGEVPKLAVLLGLLSPTFYEIYKRCDGNTSLETIAKDLGLKDQEIRIYTDKLAKSKMIEL